MPVTETPLRYPGGKTQITPFVVEVLRANGLFYGNYVEPFAGGCGIAWKLLLSDMVSEVYINDIDRSIFAFWKAALSHTDDLCELIETTPITIDEWHRQRSLQNLSRISAVRLGFSTLFLNRTNRSGILKGGVIGGKDQTGAYPLDCRFNRADLVRKIRRIAQNRERVHLTALDAREFLTTVVKKLPMNTLVNIDPPYYKQGPELYCSFYNDADHAKLAKTIAKLKQPWMVTYDDAPRIRELYADFAIELQSLNYSAQLKRVGVELAIFSPNLARPILQAA